MNNLVDRIGVLDTQIKLLKVEFDRLTAELKAQGAGEYVGDKFRGLVVEVKSTEDDKTLKAAIKKVVEDYRAGKEKAFNSLVGQVMKATKGKANPAQVNEILRRKLAG